MNRKQSNTASHGQHTKSGKSVQPESMVTPFIRGLGATYEGLQTWDTADPAMLEHERAEYETGLDGVSALVFVQTYRLPNGLAFWDTWTDEAFQAFRELFGVDCWVSANHVAPSAVVVPKTEKNIALITAMSGDLPDKQATA